MLEQTLCEANTLLGESADIPMVIASNRDAISIGTSKSMTELDVSNITDTPSLVGPIQARMSEELALRLQVLKSTASAPQAYKMTHPQHKNKKQTNKKQTH